MINIFDFSIFSVIIKLFSSKKLFSSIIFSEVSNLKFLNSLKILASKGSKSRDVSDFDGFFIFSKLFLISNIFIVFFKISIFLSTDTISSNIIVANKFLICSFIISSLLFFFLFYIIFLNI